MRMSDVDAVWREHWFVDFIRKDLTVEDFRVVNLLGVHFDWGTLGFQTPSELFSVLHQGFEMNKDNARRRRKCGP